MGRRILVVEDDASLRELVATRMLIAGYSVTTARDGAEALQLVNTVHPAAMILDLNMPGTDGFGVLSALQLNPRTSKLPVMVLTARNAPEDVRRVMELGARDFLSKPFSDQQLLARVTRLLRVRKTAPRAEPVEDDIVLI